MSAELQFYLKITRNGLLLSGMYFISIWATIQEIEFLPHVKPIIIFFGTYMLSEAIKRYKIDYRIPEQKSKTTTMILN